MVVRAFIAFLRCIVVMQGACSSSASMPDAAAIDSAVGGFAIELAAKGGVPQMPDVDVEITKVVFGATAIRAIGDAAPGDVRTTRPNYEFEFRDNLVPIPILFGDAPPGLYSTVELHIKDSASSVDAVSIIGRARRGGSLVPFEIQNKLADVPISIAINKVLVPREFLVTVLEVDVPALVDDIDWDTVPLTMDGRLYIGDGDPAMSGVVASLATAFKER